MMLKPLRDKTQGQRTQISQARPLVAPVKGWYVGAPMADAPAGTAFLLENAFPEFDYVRIRAGAKQFATGMSGVVRTLMPFTDGVNVRLFALNGGNIYEVSNGGTATGPVVSGLDTVAFMSSMQYSGTGPQTLVCSNGVNPLQFFNGSVWSTSPAWTGLGANPISHVWEYNHRLYGIAVNTTDVYYVGVNAIGGKATIYPMGPLLRLGGALIAGGTWTQLTSNGEQYNWFVISSEGELVIFSGSFPGDSGSWRQTGCYKVGRPLGKNCIQTIGGDVAILTEDGVEALSQAREMDQTALANKAITLPIAPAYRDAVLARSGLSGWQMLLWPLRYMAIINMPQIGPPNTQFIANARTGYWCRYTGWDARCFAVHGLSPTRLYFGTSDGRVMQAETGGMDDGRAYCGTIFYSYSALGATDVSTAGPIAGGTFGVQQEVSTSQAVVRKHVSMVRPRFQTNIRNIIPKVTINTEFDVTVPAPPPPSPMPLGTVPGGAAWGVAKWGVDKWPLPPVPGPIPLPGGALWGSARWGVDKWPGPTFFNTQSWVPVYAMSAVMAPIIQVTLLSASTPDVRLTNIDVLFEPGNIFG